MKVLVLGVSGIIGQVMRLCVPAGVEPIWCRRHADPVTQGVDLDSQHVILILDALVPDVVVNLAGESSVDAVERNPARYEYVNAGVPRYIATWAQLTGRRYVHISSQAVWSGENAPYTARMSDEEPVNEYGRQKKRAEEIVMEIMGERAEIVRLTFVLGIRPLPHVGRQNPLEAILAGQSPQVHDRFFSVLSAEEAAESVWSQVITPVFGVSQHGHGHWSRYTIARTVNPDVTAKSHVQFNGIAERPRDTTYSGDQDNRTITIPADDDGRAIELSLFTGCTYDEAAERLALGFGPLHVAVTEDFRRVNPRNEAELLDWYRKTDAYLWELSAYHEDEGFNYSGMCRGIAEGLKAHGVKRVLCLGDGIGDLTLGLHNAGFDAVYHDLSDSRTAAFAAFRFWRHTGKYIQSEQTCGFSPVIRGKYDAVVSLDFLEHLPRVEDWVRAVHAALRPGGIFIAQNAFGAGSGKDGAMPMHLAVNDHYEKDWDPLLASIGFEQLASQWYRKAC